MITLFPQQVKKLPNGSIKVRELRVTKKGEVGLDRVTIQKPNGSQVVLKRWEIRHGHRFQHRRIPAMQKTTITPKGQRTHSLRVLTDPNGDWEKPMEPIIWKDNNGRVDVASRRFRVGRVVSNLFIPVATGLLTYAFMRYGGDHSTVASVLAGLGVGTVGGGWFVSKVDNHMMRTLNKDGMPASDGAPLTTMDAWQTLPQKVLDKAAYHMDARSYLAAEGRRFEAKQAKAKAKAAGQL